MNDALTSLVGERIADEVEKVAAGNQSNCEQAARDIIAICNAARSEGRKAADLDPRIVDYFDKAGLGLGDDPLGFLLASLPYAIHECREAKERVAELERGLEGGWLPIVLCPTDGVWRLVKLPDGLEIMAAFEGADLGPVARRWRTKTFGYHTPARPTREKFGGIERMTAPYDTAIISDLPEGVYPTHFRPNDTVYGQPALLNPSEGETGT
jgi:hypothetical protein